MGHYIYRDHLPNELKEVYVDFYWPQRKLWNLNLPIVKFEVSTLEWILDYPVWYMETHPTPKEVILNPSLSEANWKRIEQADLDFPIYVLWWKNRWLILDGIHRLIKAKHLGHTFVPVISLNNDHIHDILPDEEDLGHGFLKQFDLKL